MQITKQARRRRGACRLGRSVLTWHAPTGAARRKEDRIHNARHCDVDVGALSESLIARFEQRQRRALRAQPQCQCGACFARQRTNRSDRPSNSINVNGERCAFNQCQCGATRRRPRSDGAGGRFVCCVVSLSCACCVCVCACCVGRRRRRCHRRRRRCRDARSRRDSARRPDDPLVGNIAQQFLKERERCRRRRGASLRSSVDRASPTPRAAQARPDGEGVGEALRALSADGSPAGSSSSSSSSGGGGGGGGGVRFATGIRLGEQRTADGGA